MLSLSALDVVELNKNEELVGALRSAGAYTTGNNDRSYLAAGVAAATSAAAAAAAAVQGKGSRRLRR